MRIQLLEKAKLSYLLKLSHPFTTPVNLSLYSLGLDDENRFSEYLYKRKLNTLSFLDRKLD